MHVRRSKIKCWRGGVTEELLSSFDFSLFGVLFDRYSAMYSHGVFTLMVTLFSVDIFKMMILLRCILGIGQQYKNNGFDSDGIFLTGHYLYVFM